MTLYNLRSEGSSFRITKFDSDLNIESTYLTGFTECECPAGSRPSCRHRLMFADILPLANTAYFWDFDNRLIVDSDGEPATYAEVEASRNDPGLDTEGPLSGVTVAPNASPVSGDILPMDTYLNREGVEAKDVTPAKVKATVTPREDNDIALDYRTSSTKAYKTWRRI